MLVLHVHSPAGFATKPNLAYIAVEFASPMQDAFVLSPVMIHQIIRSMEAFAADFTGKRFLVVMEVHVTSQISIG